MFQVASNNSAPVPGLSFHFQHAQIYEAYACRKLEEAFCTKAVCRGASRGYNATMVRRYQQVL